MFRIYYKVTFCFLVNILCINTVLGQDSLYTFPSAKKIDLIVHADIKSAQNENIYFYRLISKASSEQEIFQFFLEIGANVKEINSPNMWSGEISEVRKRIVFWGSRDSSVDIFPSSSLEGFNFKSKELPSIIIYYGRGYFELPNVAEGEAPPLEATVGADIFENSVKGKTIGPRALPENITNSALADTLQSYLSFSCDTTWIANQGICRSLEAKLENAEKQLERENSNAASGSLQAFLSEVEAQKDKQLSSEAYALLYFNGRYLLERL